jgi:hypothetical protein
MKGRKMKKVLINFVGGTDPTGGDGSNIPFSDGPILALTKETMPDVIYLLFTEEMIKKEDILRKHIEYSYNSVQIPKIINLYLNENNDYFTPSNFLQPHNFENNSIIHRILDYILLENQNSLFFANISSGSPQLLSSLTLDICLNRRDIKCKQVTTPIKKSNYAKKDIPNPGDYDDPSSIERVRIVKFNKLNNELLKNQTEFFLKKYEYHNIKILKISNDIVFNELLERGINYNKNQVDGYTHNQEIVVALRLLKNCIELKQVRHFFMYFEVALIALITLYIDPKYIAKNKYLEDIFDLNKVKADYTNLFKKEKEWPLNLNNIISFIRVAYKNKKAQRQILDPYRKFITARNNSVHQLKEIESFDKFENKFENGGKNIFNDIHILINGLIGLGDFSELTDSKKYHDVFDVPDKLNKAILKKLDELL